MNIFAFFSANILNIFKSKINNEIRVVKRTSGKIIYVDKIEQTGGTITGMWQKVFAQKAFQEATPKKCLLLGLGGGDVIRIIRKIYTGIIITAVEIDPVMIKIAGIHFGLTNSYDLKIIRQDAYQWIGKIPEKFDLIVIDLFIGKYNPEKFRRQEFLNLLSLHLKKNGMAVYNSHYDQQKPADFQKFHLNCLAVFKKVEIIVKYRYSRILLLYP